MISSQQRPLSDNTQHSRQTSMTQREFEPTISAGERPQSYALDRAATGIGSSSLNLEFKVERNFCFFVFLFYYRRFLLQFLFCAPFHCFTHFSTIRPFRLASKYTTDRTGATHFAEGVKLVDTKETHWPKR
jgi:hypothetical protein